MYIVIENYDASEGNSIGIADKGLRNTGNYVSRVIDGDTFVLGDGERVRLICIDTPENGEDGFEEAKEFLEDLVLEREIRLEKDVSDRDKYSRLLRYVWVKLSKYDSLDDGYEVDDDLNVFVNREIVRRGYGKVYKYPPDTSLCDEIGE
ncbi:hypothetical protein GOV12_05600 [Candidatus Pacearchaeota archaeon]|nr:hypothetical protein [Candidatus Pacearchaeota archaeon]